MNSFSILPGHPSSPVILHVPHASREIPPHVRAQLLFDDAALDAELDEATDADTDLIATLGADRGGSSRQARGSSSTNAEPIP